MVQPKPAASSISWRTWEPMTSSFFGTQPRITQVPPMRYSSAIMTLAPWPAAIRAARTPPEPPPITNRSTSNSAIPTSTEFVPGSDLLAALAHLGTKLAVDDFGELLRPLVHIGHAELDGAGLVGEQLLPKRRLVERHQVLQLLLGKFVGIDLRHALTDLLLAAGEILRHDHRNLVEVLLVIEVRLKQRVLGLLDDIRNRVGIHRGRVLHGQDFLGGSDRGRSARLQRGRRLLLRAGRQSRHGQCEEKARSRQHSENVLHSDLSLISAYGRSTTRSPCAPASITVLANPTNRPCSTTPGMMLRSFARWPASCIRPRWASTIQWPPSVTKTWPSRAFR